MAFLETNCLIGSVFFKLFETLYIPLYNFRCMHCSGWIDLALARGLHQKMNKYDFSRNMAFNFFQIEQKIKYNGIKDLFICMQQQ